MSKAAAFSLAGAVLTYFGFMHGEAVGIGGGLGVTPPVALAYVAVAAILYGLAKSEAVARCRARRLQRPRSSRSRRQNAPWR